MGKSLVIGGLGMIGSAFMDHLYSAGEDVVGTSRNQVDGYEYLDLSDFPSIRACVDRVAPEVIYLTGAVSTVDKCGKDYDRKVNLLAPRYLATVYPNIKIVFMSSAYVFGGLLRGLRGDENTVYSAPAPLNYYGMEKLEAERAVLENPENVVVRLSSVFGEDLLRKNFAYQVIDHGLAGETIHAYIDQYVTPVLASDVAAKSVSYVGIGGRGLVHCAGDTHVSKFTWALDLLLEFGLSPELLTSATRVTHPQQSYRPENGTLKSTFKTHTYLESLEKFHEIYQRRN